MGGCGGRGGRGSWAGGRGGSREMDRPWVTPGLRQEILKTKVSLNDSSSPSPRGKRSLRAWQVLQEKKSQQRQWQRLESNRREWKHCWRKQRSPNWTSIFNILIGKHCTFQWGKQLKTNRLQVHWLARHPEHEQAWLNVLAEEERYNCRFP